MAILLDRNIPINVDVNNPQALHDFLINMKLVIEEIASKTQKTQTEIRTSAPSTDDLTENEFVRATVGGNHYIYTMKGGTIFRWQIT